MQWFLERINTPTLPISFGSGIKLKYPGDFSKLMKKGVLKRAANLSETECGHCYDERLWQIREDNGEIFYICQNGCGKLILNDEDVAIFEYNDAKFRQLLADELGLKTSGVKPRDTRYIGQYQGQKTSAKVFYLRTNEESVRDGDLGFRPRVLVSNTGTIGVDEDDVSHCALSEILAPSSDKNIFDKTAFAKCISHVGRPKNKPEPIKIKVKSVRLDGRLLIINNGQETISFNSTNSEEREGDIPASKTFKVFNLLWADHYEMKDRAITNRNGKMTSAANLMRVGGIPTRGALYKQIDRINARFAEKGLKIKISKGEKCKLTVYFE